jgi:acyl-CoA thioesterase I
MRQNFLYVLLISVLLLALVIFFFPKSSDETKISSQTLPSDVNAKIQYLPLGDSYTIGEGLRENERFPNQLTAKLRDKGYSIELLGNPSRTGYTTLDLIENELPVLAKSNANFITLLIGVNDQVQKIDTPTFRTRLERILAQVKRTKPQATIIILTIPDYTFTKAGLAFGDATKNSKALEEYNNAIKEVASRQNIPIVDITDISNQVKNDSSLTSSDKLHPSAKHYGLWVEKILPTAEALLR